MGNSRRGPIPSELGWLIDALDGFEDRLKILESPSGETLGNTVEKMQILIANIQAQLDVWVASRYTNEEIEDLIDMKVAAYVASILAGNVSIGGALNVVGAVTMPGVRGTDLTAAANRVTVWQAGPTDNRLGHT